MDWIISDEYKLTVGHVLGHLAAASMILGGLCECAKLQFPSISSTTPTQHYRYSALRAAISSNRKDTECGRLQSARLPCAAHRQHPEDILLVSFTQSLRWPSGAICNNCFQFHVQQQCERERSWLIIAKSWLCSFSHSAVRCWATNAIPHSQLRMNEWIFSDAVACVSHLKCVSLFMFMLSSQAAA